MKRWLDQHREQRHYSVAGLMAQALSEASRANGDPCPSSMRERITEVKRDQRKRGRLPFGWRKGEDGNLVPIPEQQAAIEQMRRLRAKGIPLRTIADKLTAAGTPISHQGVKKVLLAAEGGSAAA